MAEIEENVNEDLEKTAIEICAKILEGETIVVKGYECVVVPLAEECFKAGAKWKEQQMMKNAVNGFICEALKENELFAVSSNVSNDVYQKGERIKLIIIKQKEE